MRSSIRGKGEEGSPGSKGGAGYGVENRAQQAPGNRVWRGGQCGLGGRDASARFPLARFCSWSPDFGLMLQRGRGAHRDAPFSHTESATTDSSQPL